ncbi:PAS-domain containing protein, partial [Escherichia coli]|uniref:PAS-domain containing protein n=1 Tax=Escherichia coli TaxID=562 RepID=UPI00215B09E3
CMFDAEQRVVVSNARYGEMYHLGREQTKPGTSLRQILQYRRDKGTDFAVAPDVYVNANVMQASEVQELADGRVISIARHSMPN